MWLIGNSRIGAGSQTGSRVCPERPLSNGSLVVQCPTHRRSPGSGVTATHRNALGDVGQINDQHARTVGIENQAGGGVLITTEARTHRVHGLKSNTDCQADGGCDWR